MFWFRNSIKFYQASKVLTVEGLLDFLLKRYSNIDYVLNLEAKIGFSLIIKAIDNSNEEKMYQKWLHDTARFEMSFEQYKEAHMPYRKSTDKEKDDILKRWGA